MHVDIMGESRPSFYNVLGTIYISSSRARTFSILLLEIWVWSLKNGFGKALGTKNRLTLGLTSSHCVLCLNPIKCTLNIAF